MTSTSSDPTVIVAGARTGMGRLLGSLKDFSATERRTLELLVGEAADATELLLERGLEAAQNQVHPRS